MFFHTHRLLQNTSASLISACSTALCQFRQPADAHLLFSPTTKLPSSDYSSNTSTPEHQSMDPIVRELCSGPDNRPSNAASVAATLDACTLDEAASCRPGAPEEDAVAVVAAVVDVDLRDGDGLTQLMKSAYEGKVDNVQWLLEQEVR